MLLFCHPRFTRANALIHVVRLSNKKKTRHPGESRDPLQCL